MPELTWLLIIGLMVIWPVICKAEIEHIWKSHNEEGD